MRQRPFRLPGIGRRHGDFDAADAEADLGADFQELEADCAAGCRREPGVGEADAPERAEQHIRHRGEPQPELVGAHRRRRRAVGQEVELAFLDPVPSPARH